MNYLQIFVSQYLFMQNVMKSRIGDSKSVQFFFKKVNSTNILKMHCYWHEFQPIRSYTFKVHLQFCKFVSPYLYSIWRLY